jgi:hypothetical protein
MAIVRLIAAWAILAGSLYAQSLDTMLVLEMSEGSEHATGLVRPRAFPEDDRAGVIGFLRTAQVLQPLTADRDKLAAALKRAGFRAGGAVVQGGKVGTVSSLTVGLTAALFKACGEFGQPGGEEPAGGGRKRAILVVFGTDDPSLSSNLNALKATLRTAQARLYAVAVQRSDPNAPPQSPRIGVNYPFPVMTARLLSQLAEETGGRVFERHWDFKKILAAAHRP